MASQNQAEPCSVRRPLRGWALVAMVALAIAACGSDSEGRDAGPEAGPVAAAVTVAPPNALPSSRESMLLSFAPVVKNVAPAVVNIYTRTVVKATENPLAPLMEDPLFRRFFGDGIGRGIPRERVERSLGSGVIVRPDGIIVTSYHVVGGASEITVALPDRREFEAKVILSDESTDLAVLKIDTGKEKLPYLHLRDSDQLEVGDVVLAIGNPFGVGQTVTSGIISAVARTNVGISDYQFFIQTDAAINPGNSGGALVTTDGRLAGINTAIFSKSGGYMGIGFAIPSNMVDVVVTAAETGGKVIRPWFGASGQPVTAEIARSLGLERPIGILVDDIYGGGPADAAGIKVGDIITHVGGYEISTPEALRFRLRVSEKDKSQTVPVRILRSGKERMVEVALKPAPETPPRNLTTLSGENFLTGVEVGNLSPAFAEELKLDPMLRGVVVVALAPASPAQRYRLLRPGDVLLAVNGERVTSVSEVQKALQRNPASFNYKVQRGDQTVECGRSGGGIACR